MYNIIIIVITIIIIIITIIIIIIIIITIIIITIKDIYCIYIYIPIVSAAIHDFPEQFVSPGCRRKSHQAESHASGQSKKGWKP